MSKKEKETPVSQQEEKKVVTRYDRKLERRREAEKKEKRDQKRNLIIGVCAAVVVLVFVASFPVRNLMAVYQKYMTVDGERVSRVEFDYYYYLAKNNYVDQVGSYLSMMGITDMSTLDSQMYSSDMTFGDYFTQVAVERMAQTRALQKEARAAGFEYDADGELKELEEGFREAAQSLELSFGDYLKEAYGPYATMGRLKKAMRENLESAAYLEKLEGENKASQEEIEAYYEENKDTYDSVDYHYLTVNAQLPTTAPDGSVPTDEDGNEVAYEPTEEEVAAAMEQARQDAQEALATVAQEGEAVTGRLRSGLSTVLADYLFDPERVQGDSSVLEDTSGNRYYVVSFDGRYRDETPTVDLRAIITQSTDAQTIYDEWKSGEATEASFIETAKKYDENGMEINDFLYEQVDTSGLEDAQAEWITAPERAAGDAAAFTGSDGVNYVFYYMGQNDPVWKINVGSLLLNQWEEEYLNGISEDILVKDRQGVQIYPEVAQESSETEDGEAAGSSESSESE